MPWNISVVAVDVTPRRITVVEYMHMRSSILINVTVPLLRGTAAGYAPINS